MKKNSNFLKKLSAFCLGLAMTVGVGYGIYQKDAKMADAADGDTATLTFTEACGGKGTDDSNVAWTVTSDAAESTFSSDYGVHYGTGSKAVSYLTLTSGSYTEPIKQVDVWASDANKTATISVKVNGLDFGESAKESSYNNKQYTFTPTEKQSENDYTGVVEVKLSRSSAKKALYVMKIMVTFGTATSGGGDDECKHSNINLVNAKNATCTEDGNIAYYTCGDCGAKFSDVNGTTPLAGSEIVSATGHNYDVIAPEVPSTCTSKGTIAYKHCSNCNKNFSSDGKEVADISLPLAAHTYNDGVCSACGAQLIEYEQVNNASTLKAGDVFVLGCAAKNTAAGAMGSGAFFTSVSASFENGVLKSEDAIEITLGGEKDAWTLTTNEGLVGTTAAKTLVLGEGTSTWKITISNGSASITSTTSSYGTIKFNASAPRFLNYTSGQTAIEIYKKPCLHETLSFVPSTATCTANGLSEYWVCSSCGQKFSDENGLNKITDASSKTALGHNYGEWTVTKEASCTEEGSRQKTCLRCGDVVIEAIDKIPHSLVVHPQVDATQEKTGTKTYYECSVCKNKYFDGDCTKLVNDDSELVIEMLTHEHSTTSDWAKDESNHWHVCDDCLETFEVSTHNFNNGVVTPSTCTTHGKITYTCETCNYIKETELPLEEHTYVSVAEVSPTFEETGVKAHYKCSECNDLFDFVDGQYVKVSEQDLEITKVQHSYNGAYEYNETEHWRMCSDAGYETMESTHENHAFVKDEDLSEEATASREGMLVEKCICGKTRKTLIDPEDSVSGFSKVNNTNFNNGSLISGDYLLTTVSSSNYYYVKNEINSYKIGYDSVTVENDFVSDSSLSPYLWTISKVDGGYTLYNKAVGKYLAATGTKSQAALQTSQDEKAVFNIEVKDNLNIRIISKYNSGKNVNAVFRYQSGQGFTCYAAVNGDDLTVFTPITNSQVAIRYEDGNGGRVGASVGIPGTKLEMNNGKSLFKEGYCVTGWKDADGNEVNLNTFPQSSMIVYPIWTEQYTITWKNGDTTLETDKVKSGDTPSYNGQTPTKAGDAQYSYTFNGWTPEVTSATNDITYSAQFTQTVNEYTITFNVNGTTTSKTLEYGTAITADTPSNYSLNNYYYTFAGWSKTSATSSDYSTSLGTVEGNATFYAVFTKTGVISHVSCIVDGEEYGVKLDVEYGSKLYLTDAPEKEGYTFNGWYINGTEKFVSGSTWNKPEGTYELEAEYTPNQYTITLSNNGATTEQKVTYGLPYRIDDPEERLGYTFEGWYNGNTAFAASGTWNYTQDVTLTAKWTKLDHFNDVTESTSTWSEVTPTEYKNIDMDNAEATMSFSSAKKDAEGNPVVTANSNIVLEADPGKTIATAQIFTSDDGSTVPTLYWSNDRGASWNEYVAPVMSSPKRSKAPAKSDLVNLPEGTNAIKYDFSEESTILGIKLTTNNIEQIEGKMDISYDYSYESTTNEILSVSNVKLRFYAPMDTARWASEYAGKGYTFGFLVNEVSEYSNDHYSDAVGQTVTDYKAAHSGMKSTSKTSIPYYSDDDVYELGVNVAVNHVNTIYSVVMYVADSTGKIIEISSLMETSVYDLSLSMQRGEYLPRIALGELDYYVLNYLLGCTSI